MRRGWVLSLPGTVTLAAVLLGAGSSETLSREPLPQSPLPAGLHASGPAVVRSQAPAVSEPVPSPPGTSPAAHAAAEAELPAGKASPPLHIIYAGVGMDQAVLPLSPTEQEVSLGAIVPPHTADAYWLTPYGVPGAASTNTTYIVGHSWEGRPSPFNEVSSRAQPGDQLTLVTADGPLVFSVDQITTEYKDTLKDSDIWIKAPGRLILITCFTQDLWGKNIIIQASPVSTR